MSWFTKSPQFKQGMSAEKNLDNYFSERGFGITKTSPHQERVLCLGDRIFTKDDKQFFIEYKCDDSASRTGNLFFETVSVDSANKPGWVFTCRADFILCIIPTNQEILVYRPVKLRAAIEELKSKFPTVTTKSQNPGYKTHGVIVPLEYAKKYLAEKTLKMK